MHLIRPTTAAEIKTGDRILAIQERGMGAESETPILEVTRIFPLEQTGWKAERIPGELLMPEARAIFTLVGYGTTRDIEMAPTTPLLALGAML